ncbi:MAG: hypothetical protein HOP17_03885 [Acidobacteria bacterium]|nr:hypothetical protein [Acidobacteriota bacterium]
MSTEKDNGGKDERDVRFPPLIPHTDVKGEDFVDLGTTPLAKQLGLSPEQTNGHWCSRCRGIWFGYTLETQCPVCGNRRG